MSNRYETPQNQQKFNLIEAISEGLRKSINFMTSLPYRSFSCKPRRAKQELNKQSSINTGTSYSNGTSVKSKTLFDRSLLANPDSSISDLQVSQAITFAFLPNSEIPKESTSSLSSLDKPIDFNALSPPQIEACLLYETWIYAKRYIANAKHHTVSSNTPSIENYLQSKL